MTPTLSPVNYDHEVAAIVDFIGSRWEPISNLAEIVAEAAASGWYAARAWVDRYGLVDLFDERKSAREALLAKHLTGSAQQNASWHDLPSQYLTYLTFEMDKLHKLGQSLDGPWRYDKAADAVYARLLAKHPTLAQAKPLGWEQLAQAYTDFDGMDEYCEAQQDLDVKAFKGKPRIGALLARVPFPCRIAYVMYDDVGQGRSAPLTLVSSIFSQFLTLREQENMRTMQEALCALDLADQTPGMVFDLNPTSDHPLVKALLALIRQRLRVKPADVLRAEFEEACRQSEAYELLSPEEKAARAKAVDQELADMVKELLAEDAAPAKAEPKIATLYTISS